MAHVDFFFATISPYTCLCGTEPAEIAARHGATITYKPFDIMGIFPRTGGTAPKDRHPSRMEYRAQDLARQAAKRGLPLNLRPAFWPTNAAPSSYAIISAQTAGGGNLAGLVAAIGRACWCEDRNIAEDDVIRDALASNGFDPGLADRGMLAAAETYAANLEEAVARGVFGAPFFITDGDARFWGQDRLDDLDAHLAGRL